MEILKNIVAFSEYMNFTTIAITSELLSKESHLKAMAVKEKGFLQYKFRRFFREPQTEQFWQQSFAHTYPKIITIWYWSENLETNLRRPHFFQNTNYFF